MDPRIHIGIDNCFALKRWTTPAEWAKVVKDLGMKYIEGVPDLEAEPFLMPADYLDEWIEEVCRVQKEEDVQTVMLYSNDSTYDTQGFAHFDKRVRDKIVDGWFGGFCKTAAGIGADIGYYVCGLPESILFDKQKRKDAQEIVIETMARVNKIAESYGIDKVALEQMYTPHQPPFTIDTMRQLMQAVKQASGKALYITEDVGHHCPFYNRPTEDDLQKAFIRYKKDGYIGVWLGSLEAKALFTGEKGDKLSADTIKAIFADMDENPGMFSEPRDTDCYEWLRNFGCFSPTIHMQQTDGTFSGHQGFLPDNNESGIIHPVKVLEAIQESYNRVHEADMPDMCEDIYLIQELYLSTKDIGYQGLWKMKTSTDYLRKFIPKDGMRLSELIELNKNNK